jgi:hypothetical protein
MHHLHGAQSTTFFLNRISFIYPVQKFLEQVNMDGRLRYSFIEE